MFDVANIPYFEEGLYFFAVALKYFHCSKNNNMIEVYCSLLLRVSSCLKEALVTILSKD
jgi:hypothetical protein